MIRFALVVASVLGFFLTAAIGNLMVPLLRQLAPSQREEEKEAEPAPSGWGPRERGLPTLGGLCFMTGTLAAVGMGWTAVCLLQPERCLDFSVSLCHLSQFLQRKRHVSASPPNT